MSAFSKMFYGFTSRSFETNSIDALVPEIWANEALMILIENMVAANLVHRDYSNAVANFGDVVNVHKPSEYVAKRKGPTDNVTVQDTNVTNVQVPLNQHIHVSFMIRDQESSLAFKDLVTMHLEPAMQANARFLDQLVLARVYQVLSHGEGYLDGLTTSNTISAITSMRAALGRLKAPEDGRSVIISPETEATLLQVDLFVSSERAGNTNALERARIGKKFGFDWYMAQNVPYVVNAAGGGTVDVTTGAINNAAGYAIGATSLTVDGFTGDKATAGAYLTIAGDNTPIAIASSSLTTGNTTTIVLATGLKRAVADNAVITIYNTATVNLTAGYAAGYGGTIVLDGFTSGKFLQVGQAIAFGTTTRHTYMVMEVTGASGTAQTVLLDRPLDYTVANDAVVYPLPAGAYNLSLHRNAFALVSRPLALPAAGTGARAGSATYDNIGMRVVITYDGNKQGHLVTVDLLCGIATLDANRAIPFYA